ncbi:MAG: hypothetical protein NW226_04565 [Microscillaceae bacterium]|nr:hypothetical protein [Microscillaceae bacterium]
MKFIVDAQLPPDFYHSLILQQKTYKLLLSTFLGLIKHYSLQSIGFLLGCKRLFLQT